MKLRMDSKLVVEQVNGRYTVKKAALKLLHAEILGILKGFARYAVAHVPRAKNQRADELANLASATLSQ